MNPSLSKTHGFQNVQKKVFNKIKGFFKVQFEYNGLLLGLVTLMHVFKSLGQAILYSPGFYKTILIGMHKPEDDCLKPVGQQFCDYLSPVL